MASAPSMSVSMECVNVCKLSKGEASWRSDCSVLSCAWKAPRVLTGFLASTPHTPQCSSYAYGRTGRRNLNSRCQIFEVGAYSNYPSKLEFLVELFRLDLSHHSCKRWQLCCNSRASAVLDDNVSPESLWEFLKPQISYISTKELDLVYSALKLAFEAHDGQRRRSGEPFILHPVEVARILGELELDWECIAAGLLHDTVEDTSYVSFARIEEEFGAAVRRIVEGETKVSKLGKIKSKNENSVVQDVKADDLHQMFLAMTEEVRVIIVKLADRLHNMRTLSYMPLNKQYSIATETLQIFAPLAKLLGMYQIKSELENLSFMYTKSEDYTKVKRRVAELYTEHERELVEVNRILKKKIEDDQFLNSMPVKTEVRVVCKEPYSVYKAALKSRNSIDEINQIAQLRIIVQPNTCIGVGPLCTPQQICYHVLGLVHGIWSPVPGAVKDYIATPKPNGYQSLHTTVLPFLYESMFRLEVQIRTEEMDLIAERGIAAHYSGRRFATRLVGHAIPSYNSPRENSVCLNSTNIALRVSWLNAIREWQEEFVGNMSSREFVDTITRDLLGSGVFVFTPRGEIKNLPKGATVIDYAYMIHTEIGNKMVAAKVNGNPVSPTRVLANAEVVEVITYNALSSKSAIQRHKQWLQHAKTRSARHKIVKFLKEQATFSAADIKADTGNDGITYSEEESEAEELSDIAQPKRPFWEEVLNTTDLPFLYRSSQTGFPIESGRILVPKVNGKHNKHVQHVSLKSEELFSVSNGLAKTKHASAQRNEDVLPGLVSWQTSKVASWHNLEGHSIQWFCVVSVDRRGIVAEVTSALASVGISICSSVTEIDRGRGMMVMLFHVEASLENLVSASSSVDLILGDLQWSAGCSWPSWSGNPQLPEC